jgi:malonyl-CoA O-methyltransferase
MTADTRRAVDSTALARALRRQSLAAQPPWLHGEVARRMAERLSVVRLKPTVLIDWWSAIGASRELLHRAYPKAQALRVEPSAMAARSAPPWWRSIGRRAAITIEPAALPLGSAQLLWANMVLHAVSDPGALIAQWRRALSVDGFLMFSTLGPDTLKTLREVYRDARWGPAHAPFVDMHDLGDMLVSQGFADPVMDQELLRLTWPTAAAALAELRSLGGNADLGRHPGLRTPGWRARLESALAERSGDGSGRIALEFEIVYGHAFNPAPRVRAAGETRLAADELQRMARAGRRDGTLG